MPRTASRTQAPVTAPSKSKTAPSKATPAAPTKAPAATKGKTLAERRAELIAERSGPVRKVKPSEVIAPEEPEDDEEEEDDDDELEDEDDEEDDTDDEDDDDEEDEEEDSDDDADDDEDDEDDEEESDDEDDDDDEDSDDDEDDEPFEVPPPVKKGPLSQPAGRATKPAPAKAPAKAAPAPVAAKAAAKTGKSSPPAAPTRATGAKKGTTLPVVQTPRSGGALARPEGAPRSRARDLDAADQIMPKLKLGQGLSKAVMARSVQLGSLYLSGRNLDLGDTAYIIPVDMVKSRSIYVNGKGTICRSFDMVIGVGDPGVLCEGTEDEITDPDIAAEDRGCEYRLWSNDGDRRVPPPCQVAYNYPVIIAVPNDDGDLEGEGAKSYQAVLTIRSTSTVAARTINTAMQAENPRWLDNVFELTSVAKTNQSGSFFVMSANWFGTTEDYPKLRKRAEQYERIAGNNSTFIEANLDSDDRDVE